MTELVIPDDIRLFILHRIDSIAQLEGLLLLRANAEREWSTLEVAQRLYISEPNAAEILARLCADGFLTTRSSDTPSYQYRPSSSELQAMVDRLAETYARQLVPVTNLIHGKAKSRVQEFADAFKLRERK